MSAFVYFVFIHLHVVFAASLAENGFNKSEAGALYSAESNFETTCPTQCVLKCCPKNQIFRWSIRSCVPDVNNLQQIPLSSHFPEFQVQVTIPTSYSLCQPDKPGLLNSSIEVTKFIPLKNGSLYAPHAKVECSYGRYCVDYFADDGKISALVCFDRPKGASSSENPTIRISAYRPIGFGIANIFLIITLGLYLLTPKLRKNLHDKCFLFYTFSLIIGFSSLMVVHKIHPEDCICSFAGYMSMFWILASFFWLNVMCIHTWRSIGDIKSLKESNVWKLRIYCLYAWGCPGLILMISLLADSNLPPGSPWKPDFAETRCWFTKNYGIDSWVDPTYVYFYSFVSITLVVNIFTFVDTAIMLMNQNKSWKQRKNPNRCSKRHTRKSENSYRRFILYLKLFSIMGLNWLIDVISYHLDDEQNTFWPIVDCINTITFQGFFIFIIFVCNKRVIVILKHRFFGKK